MPSPIRQLNSQTSYMTDGTTTVWNFNFSQGYLETAHVKASLKLAINGDVSPVTLVVTGPAQVTITPALAAGDELTIYRDTPKAGPLVDFIDRANLTEVSLDYSAKQAIFCAAEAYDWASVVGAQVEAVNVYQAAIATGPVASVQGRTGTVVLTKADITYGKADVGLGNVDNTADASKPISTAQAVVNASLTGGAFRLTGITSAALTVNAAQKVTWLAESYDQLSEVSTSAFVASRAGVYNFSCSLGLRQPATSMPVIGIYLYVNGTQRQRLYIKETYVASEFIFLMATCDLLLAATDSVEVYVVTGTGNAAAYEGNTGPLSYFTGHFVRA